MSLLLDMKRVTMSVFALDHVHLLLSDNKKLTYAMVTNTSLWCRALHSCVFGCLLFAKSNMFVNDSNECKSINLTDVSSGKD